MPSDDKNIPRESEPCFVLTLSFSLLLNHRPFAFVVDRRLEGAASWYLKDRIKEEVGEGLSASRFCLHELPPSQLHAWPRLMYFSRLLTDIYIFRARDAVAVFVVGKHSGEEGGGLDGEEVGRVKRFSVKPPALYLPHHHHHPPLLLRHVFRWEAWLSAKRSASGASANEDGHNKELLDERKKTVMWGRFVGLGIKKLG